MKQLIRIFQVSFPLGRRVNAGLCGYNPLLLLLLQQLLLLSKP